MAVNVPETEALDVGVVDAIRSTGTEEVYSHLKPSVVVVFAEFISKAISNPSPVYTKGVMFHATHPAGSGTVKDDTLYTCVKEPVMEAHVVVCGNVVFVLLLM